MFVAAGPVGISLNGFSQVWIETVCRAGQVLAAQAAAFWKRLEGLHTVQQVTDPVGEALGLPKLACHQEAVAGDG